MKHLFVCLSFAALCVVSNAAEAEIESTVVFESGKDGYHTYRIPSLFVTKKGTVLAFCEGRKTGAGDAGDIDLLVKRSTDSGRSWSDQKIVYEDGGDKKITIGNPCPVQDAGTGRILLPFCRNNRTVHITYSDDEGKTWSRPEEITSAVKAADWQWYATGPGIGIQLQSEKYRGRLVIPCDHSSKVHGRGSHVIYSDDHGKSWHRSIAIGNGPDECQIVELSDGRLLMNTRMQSNRDRTKGHRGISFSKDGGETWAKLTHTKELPGIKCQGSLIRGSHKDLLFSHPFDGPGKVRHGRRHQLTLWQSTDEGSTWQVKRQIHTGPAAYSCLAVLPDGMLGCLYEGGKDRPYESIILARFETEPKEARESTRQSGRNRKNVLFLAVDDMNDWVGCLDGYAADVHTPNIDRLASSGVLFTNAHCASPLCCPSRTSVMTGQMPSTTGVYNNGQWWRPHMPEAVTLPMEFRAQGYKVVGVGKIFHHTAGSNPPDQWDAYRRLTFQDDPWFRGAKLNYPWSKTSPFPKEFPFSGVRGLGHENDWGSLGIPENEYDDSRTAEYAVSFLQDKQHAPFFLACGVFRPHLPWYVPKKYFDLYPPDKIRLPKVPENDLDDVPTEGRRLAQSRRKEFITIKENGRWKHAAQAYLASISYADAQLGRVLKALRDSRYASNTIVVLWSDHGWHLGEKQHWLKSTLWEEATRVPLMIYVPEITKPNGRCSQPVGLVDIYPTLMELCDLKLKEGLDGVSLVPLLKNPQLQRKRPAVTVFKPGQAAVRTQRWRYIRYQDRTEELYDHEHDSHEWKNLADIAEYADVKRDLSRWLPTKWAKPAANKSALLFHPKTYTWTRKNRSKDKISLSERSEGAK